MAGFCYGRLELSKRARRSDENIDHFHFRLPGGFNPVVKCQESSVAQRRVVLISMDGLDSRLVEHMPTLKKLMRQGTSTLRAETPLPAVTVVSHAAMLSGAEPRKNGIATNQYPRDPGEQSRWRPLKVPTVVSALSARGRYVSAFVQKPKMIGLVPFEAVSGMRFFHHDHDYLVGAARAELADPPEKGIDAVVFIHMKMLDAAGHDFGWLSPRQIAAAVYVDEDIQDLLDYAERGDARFGLSTVFIVTSDHGGHGKTHGTKADSRVPWIAAGPGLKRGYAIKGPVRLMDTAPTILKCLGYDPKTVLPSADGMVIQEIFAD
jgi:arylsulfatase A-like enzyme